MSAHQRSFGEAAARGAKTPFIPISEDTIFLEPEPLLPPTAITAAIASGSGNTLNTSSSSPHSMDSWLNYSSTSSEDYSYVGQSLDELSNSDYEVKLKKASKINKRNYDHLDIGGSQVDATEDEDDRHVDEELEPVNSITTTKRPKSKERKPSTSTSRRSSYNRRNSDGITDVRMIDFAHTTFVVQNGGFSLGTTNKKVGLFI